MYDIIGVGHFTLMCVQILSLDIFMLNFIKFFQNMHFLLFLNGILIYTNLNFLWNQFSSTCCDSNHDKVMKNTCTVGAKIL